MKQQTTLLAVSGGLDSVVLAHLFHQYGFKAAIAHCNFGLRENESEEDEVFVRQLAASFGFDFFIKHFDIKTYKDSHAISTQMAARELRYSWFEEVRQASEFQWIATAHHANDSIETVILNLARGTGLSGLKGISDQRDRLIRPLLRASREEIANYAEKQGLAWREDRSNASDDYDRNLVRHHVMPVLKVLNPSLEQTFLITSERISSAEKVLSLVVQAWKEKYVRVGDYVRIPVDELFASGEASYFLWETIRHFGFNYAQNQNVINALQSQPGKLFHSETHTLLCDRLDLVISPIVQAVENEIVIEKLDNKIRLGPNNIKFELKKNVLNLTDFKNKNVACFDADRIVLPLRLRKWEAGDKFAPFGMRGRLKKVSDLFTDLKINQFEKRAVWLLVNGNDEILWIVGHRTDERYKVLESTTGVLTVTFEKDFNATFLR